MYKDKQFYSETTSQSAENFNPLAQLPELLFAGFGSGRAKRHFGYQHPAILKFNPLYCTIQIFRSAIFGEPMYAPYVIYEAAFSVVITIIGLVCFKKKQDNFILYI